MTSNKQRSAKLAALIKKTAQKLVINPKQLQKLALTLPLLALFVEEVRAATGKGTVFEDIQSLTDFVEEQNLTDEQLAEIEESLDGVELAANDVTAKDVVKAAEEEEEKALLLEEEGAAAGKRKAALLEPSGESAASGGISADGAAAAVSDETVAAAATESFELAGLVIPVAPAPLLGAVAAGLGIVTNADDGGATNTETASGTALSRTLKQLKTDGIAFVQPAAGFNVINVELGAGTALTNTTGLTLFGDSNADGTVSAAENAALQVNLVITNADQLAEVAALSGLSNFGIDSVRIDLSSQDLLNALTSDATLAADLAAIRSSGLTVTTVDMGAAASLTEAQAATLIDNGLSFAADDTITITEDANSTHLSTSLKDLQKLGVDAVAVTGAAAGADLHVTLGNGAAIDTANGALPSFGTDSALNVTLDVNGVSQLAEVATLAGTAGVDLAAKGLDNVSLNLAGQTQLDALLAANVGSNSALDQSLSAVRTEGLGVNTIDMGSTTAMHLSDVQASGLVIDGLHFAANDNIEVQAAAGSTHLSTSLKDLQKLGVDTVTVTGAAAGADLHVTLGNGAAIDTANGALPSFGTDSALNVTLDVNGVSQLAEVATLAGTAGVDLAAQGLDNISLNLAGQTQLDALLAANVGSNSALDQSLSAVRTEGLGINTIDMGSTTAMHLSDVQASGLVTDGLHFAANDNIEVQAAAGSTHLSTSLKDLQKLGVDAISASGVSSMTVDMGGMTAADLAAGAKLASFDSGLNVTLNVANTAEFSTASGMAAQISAANIDSIKMDVLDTDGNSGFATELQALGDNNAFVSQVGLLHTQDVGTILDLGGVNVAGVVSISTTEAADLVDQGVSFAANDQVTFAEVLDANSTTLGSTLKDLQKLGVDAVSVTGGMPGGHLHVDFGTGSAINLAQGGLPKFASALDVTLHVADATQLNELSTLATTAGVDLAALGIDHVLLNLADQSAFDALFDSQPVLQASLTATASASSFENSLDALREEPVSVTTIDMASNAVALTQAEAGFLFEQGLEFAANDAVTLEASGTHLSTSLSELKKLGIDMVSLAGSDGPHDLNVNLGNGPNIDLSSGLPSFGADADINVTLEVANNTQLHQVAQNINNLQQLGVDEVQLNFASQSELQQFLNEDGLPAPQGGSLMDFTVNQVRNNNGVQLDTIDIGGFATAGSAHLDELQLGSIINAGLNFASADFVTVDANAGSTYLGIHTHNLSQLGVDTVHITDLSSSTSLSSITTAIQAAGVHTLGIDTSALQGSSALATNIDSFNWLASGVDFQLQVNAIPAVQTELGAAINLAQTEVNVIALTGTGLTSASNFGDLIDALQSSGMSNVEVETGASVKINDDLSAALYESGMLHALPSTTFAIDAGDSKVLNTSLKAMADLGVDEVLSAQSVDKLYVGLGENADIASIIAGFTHGSDAPVNDGLFSGKDAGLVVDQATFDQFNQGDITDLLAKLFSLGFTEIDVLKGENDSESYQITAQTQVLVPTDVQLLGVNDANALLDVFGADILDKKIS